VRWQALFADLEAQFQAEERRELDQEVAERTRRERAAIGLYERLAAAGPSAPLAIRVHGGALILHGAVADVGEGWVLLSGKGQRPVLVPFSAVLAVSGLALRAAPEVAGKRFGFGYALRGLSRDRAAVALTDVTGVVTTGTIDAVGADVVDLSEHPGDEPRRQGSVVARRLVPFSAIACLAPV
jgi:hypothetical protein